MFLYAIYREFLSVFCDISKGHSHLLILKSQFGCCVKIVILESISGFVILMCYQKNSPEVPEDGVQESRNASEFYLKKWLTYKKVCSNCW